MKTIAVLNQKGGSCKTTTATHLARALQLDGYSVILVDSDKQGSTSRWAISNEEQPVEVIKITRPAIDQSIRLLKGYDYCIIDGKPSADLITSASIKAADVVLIPVTPSQFDLWATEELIEMVEKQIAIRKGALKAVFLMSRAIFGTIIARDVTDALDTHPTISKLKTTVYQRVDYLMTVASGKTIFDTKNDAGIEEMTSLKNEILQLCNDA